MFDSDETNESQKEKTSNVKAIIKKLIKIKRVKHDTKQLDEIIFLSPFISLSELLIQMISLFLEDFDRYSLSQTCLVMNKIFKSRNFH